MCQFTSLLTEHFDLSSRDVRIMLQLLRRILYVYFTGLIYFKSDLENVLLLLYTTLLWLHFFLKTLFMK